MSWRRVAAGALVATSAACSLLVPVPTDEFSNGARAEGGSDGGSSSSSGDSGPQSVSEGGACDATFCESFDDGRPLGEKWDMTRTNAGDLTLVSEALSPPNALQMHLVEQPEAGTKREAFLAKDFPFPKRAHCSFEAFVVKPVPPDNDVELLSFRAKSGSDSYSTFVKINASGWLAREDITGQPTKSSDTLKPGATDGWVHVVFDAELGNNATLTINDKTTSLALRPFTSGTLTLGLGESGDSDLADLVLRIDDLACSFMP